jgi:hypothetical protein
MRSVKVSGSAFPDVRWWRDPAKWRKSTFSKGADCVQIAVHLGSVRLRNSTDPDGPSLTMSRRAFNALRDGFKDGQFDSP